MFTNIFMWIGIVGIIMYFVYDVQKEEAWQDLFFFREIYSGYYERIALATENKSDFWRYYYV